ncbi:hypothetical protein Ferp_0256 [Ferroglobus placidus DSM 10642]|uniref:Uncharacterized protein n=1 Tax=Ferroglobus placidus (strain DSM 10642 / AEDII12DO) TaxID=589924 RepID=D3S1Y1_FERPA|nr:hypothetical protein [Ferroglobus placidus]ADC64438.1 hypothetical protein Ferp_0256 [Ferroglobus placidus DSM 10642]
MERLFRKVLVVSLIFSLTYPFVFNYVLEVSRPDSPKDKFDLEVFLAVGKFILITATYVFFPWIFALILAYRYGYSWKDLRGSEARKYFGIVYTLLFLVLVVGVWSVILFRRSSEYSIENKFPELLMAELVLLTIVAFFITVLLRKNNYSWRDIPELIAYSSSLSREEFASDKKANLATYVILIILSYVTFAFMLADYVLRGKIVEFLYTAVKMFAAIIVFLSPLFAVVKIFSKRRRKF